MSLSNKWREKTKRKVVFFPYLLCESFAHVTTLLGDFCMYLPTQYLPSCILQEGSLSSCCPNWAWKALGVEGGVWELWKCLECIFENRTFKQMGCYGGRGWYPVPWPWHWMFWAYIHFHYVTTSENVLHLWINELCMTISPFFFFFFYNTTCKFQEREMKNLELLRSISLHGTFHEWQNRTWIHPEHWKLSSDNYTQ